LRTQDKKNRKS